MTGTTEAQAGAVGQTLMVQGRVEIRRGKERPRLCQGLDLLLAGDVVSASDRASATVVLFANGARVALKGRSASRVEPTRLKALYGPVPKLLKPLGRALARPLESSFGPLSVRFAGVVTRPGQDPRLGPCHPRPTGAVQEPSVTLRWAGPILKETSSLRLRIRTVADGKQVFMRDLPVVTREYAVPSGLLKAGRWYAWSVTAIGERGAGQACEALLRVLTPSERKTLEQAEREAEHLREADPGDASPDLLLGQVYERLGLFEEAAEAYVSALRLEANPGASAALRRLQQSLR